MLLDAIPVVDAHCHPFPPDQAGISAQWFRDALSESLTRPASAANDTTMLSRLVRRRLAALLGCGSGIDEVLAARKAWIESRSAAAYNELLFANANIKSLLIDPGFPLPVIPRDVFASSVPTPVFEGYRTERFTDGESGDERERPFANGDGMSFPAYVDRFRAKLEEEAAQSSTRFFKTVIAYITGLEIQIVSEAEAIAAWNAGPDRTRAEEKQIRDFLFRETALKAAEHDLAFQVHTGHTSDSLEWAHVNPINLIRIAREPDMLDVRFVLVHGGYPFNTEAGYLTSVFPNMYLDLSLMIPWGSIGARKRILDTLEIAPTAKVMYGSDGIMIPELFWISAQVMRSALSEVLDDFVARDLMDEGEALEVARDMLHRTAEHVYGITSE